MAEIIDSEVLALLERTITGIEGLDKLLATFRPDGLEAGDYTLEVALRNLSRGPSSPTRFPLPGVSATRFGDTRGSDSCL